MPPKKRKKTQKRKHKSVTPHERCHRCDDFGTVMSVSLVCMHESVIGEKGHPPMPRLEFTICSCPAGNNVIHERAFSVQMVTAGAMTSLSG